MTSTNFKIGLGDASKNSSKVLKPPGGGTSDIFGAPDPVQSRRIRNNLQSSVFGPPTNGDATPIRNKPDGNPVTGEGYNSEKPGSATAANNPPPDAPTNGTSHSAPPQRTRIPPGGYSSGLW